LELVEARGGENSVRIVQEPSRENHFLLIVEFDDADIDGAARYEVNIYYLTGGLTAIDLLSFAARPAADRVRLMWETGSEVDNAGFNVWCSEEEGEYAQINEALIPARGDPASGARYDYTDRDVTQGVTYWYKLEDVDVYGVSTFHGPVSATPGSGGRIVSPSGQE
jgi:hypothetical protein